jgi:transcriptional regulator with XRE-family HTH domain
MCLFVVRGSLLDGGRDVRTFGQTLRELRVRAGLSAGQLARRCGATSMSIYGYERGVRSPSFENLRRIAVGLGVPLDEFRDVVAPDDLRSSRARTSG